MIFVSYLRNYAIVFICLMTLYVILDLFTNLNDFANNKNGFGSVVLHIVGYYSVQTTVIFNALCEAITLLAAAFTIAWMQRSNELLPQLSAGVPTQRVIRPVLLGVVLTSALGPVNTEILIPRVADMLTVPRDDPQRLKPTQVRGSYDQNTKEHFVGAEAYRNDLKVMQFEYTSNAESSSGLVHLTAAEAVYVPPSHEKLSGGWKLYNTKPETPSVTLPENITLIVPGQYFLKTNDIDFDAVTRRTTWFMYAPTSKLWELLQKPESGRQSPIAVLFHMRLTKPIAALLMVFLGLAVILRDQNRHVFISAGYCLIVMAMFYVLTLGAKYLGDHDILPPPLAAWLPVMILGPATLAQFDAIHT
jgi:lipopolysaccharide export system permease protein